MKNLNRFILVSLSLSSLIACGNQESRSGRYKQQLALSKQIALLTKQNGELNKALAEAKGKLNLRDLANSTDSKDLKESILGFEGYEDMVVTVPVEEHREEIEKDPDNSMVILLPEGDEKDVKVLTGIGPDGEEIEIPADKIPSTPVITIGPDEALSGASVDGKVVVTEVVTPSIPEVPVSPSAPAAPEAPAVPTLPEGPAAPAPPAAPTSKGLKLDTLRFTDDHEPWFKGGAEVYAVVAFMDRHGNGVTKTIEIEGADKKNVTYSIDKVIHMWDDNQYQFVNVAFMEHDSSADLTKISETALSAASKVVNSLYPAAVSAATRISDVLGAALKALPNKIFADDDDHMDTVNLIEKDQNGDRKGVKGEVTISFTTYDLPLR